MIDDTISESDESDAAVNVSADSKSIERLWTAGVIDAHLAKKLGDVTDCVIEQNLDSDGMLVQGKNEADVEKAFAKLDVVLKCAQQEQTFPITRNVQISEGEINIYLLIVALGTLRDKLVTTLVPPSLANKLSKQLIVIMRRSQQTLPEVRPHHEGPSKFESLLWKDLPIRSLGQSLTHEHKTNQTKPVEQPDANKARYRTLDEWVDESSTAIPSTNPFVPLPDELKGNPIIAEKQPAEEIIKEDVATPVSPKKRPVKIRKPKGAVPMTDMEEVKGTVKGTVKELFPHETQLSTSQYIPVLSGRAIQQREPSFTGNTGEAQPLYEASADNSQEKEILQARKEYHPGTTSTHTDELWSLQQTHLPNIQPPYMPARSIVSDAPSYPNSEAGWARAGVSAATEGNLIDILAPDANQGKPKAQGFGNRKNTMNQRKPPGGGGPNSGQASVLKEYEDFAKDILSLTRTRQGIVKLEVRIGRLLIDYQSGSPEFKQRPFAPGQWHHVFPNRSEMVKLESFMTERLTSLGSDIDYISHLKLKSNRNMFTPEPCERASFYRFTCASKLQSKHVIFDIHEDMTMHTRSMEILVGSLNMHFPKRYWDARIAVTLNESVSDDHNEAIRRTVDNLCVASIADQSYIELDTDIDDKILTLRSVELHRETYHRSTNYPDLRMRLCEVQDLHLELLKLDGTQKLHAFTKPKEDMVEDMKLWWEVSVASVAATKMLEENQTLELGNTSVWKPSDITDAFIVRNMSHLARDIVTHIDSVGYYNKGPKTSTSTEASEIAANKLGFW